MEAQFDFRDLLALFNAQKVKYIVVGGYALAFHGAPRFTGDLDLFVRPDARNARLVLAALDDFGFGSIGLSAADFENPDNVVQLGVPQSESISSLPLRESRGKKPFQAESKESTGMFPSITLDVSSSLPIGGQSEERRTSPI